MSDFEKKFPFTEAEWETCLKVLSSLKDVPLNNPDYDSLKSLLQKIAKRTRKENRKMSYAEKAERLVRTGVCVSHFEQWSLKIT